MTLIIPQQYIDNGRFAKNFVIAQDGRVIIRKCDNTLWRLINTFENSLKYELFRRIEQ